MGKRRKEVENVKKQVVFNLALIALLVMLLSFNIITYPAKGMQTRNTTIKFSWLGLTPYAVVDDNPDFTSPIIVEKNKPVELKPGRYYWCVSFFNTCLKKTVFTVESEVSLVSREIKAGEENATYLVENTGNTPAKIEVKNILGRLITGLFIIEPQAGNIVEVNETAEIIATQK